MTPKFEEAFIQCLKDGVYPGPANLNERFRADKKRFNRLNGEKTKMRLALMYLFGVRYQRGHISWDYPSYSPTWLDVGEIPEWPYDKLWFNELDKPPEQSSRKAEIQDPNEPWNLRRK